MKEITMLDLRHNAAAIIKDVRRGRRYVLTYRGRPAVRLEPVPPEQSPEDGDPFYTLAEAAVTGGKNLTNREMDRIIYGA